MQKGLFRLDPRTKLLLIILINALYYMGGDYIYVSLASLFAIFLIFCSGHIKIGINATILFVFVEILSALLPRLPTAFVSTIGTAFTSILVFYPTILYGILFIGTIHISESIAAFSRWKIPQAVLIPTIVVVRFIPTLYSEMQNIRASMALRGRSGNLFTKVMNIYVPLLFSSVRTGESLTIAAMTKGMGLHKHSTVMHDSRLCKVDYFALAVLVTLMVFRWRSWEGL